MYSKVPACVFTLFPNKSACIYDNIHASKQIHWIHVDEFQNEKDIQLSLVNIMPLISILGGLVTLFIERSLDQFAGVGSSLGHKNDMFCLSGVLLFSGKVSFVVRPNIRMNSNAFNNLEGQYSPPPPPPRPIRTHLFVCKKSSSAHSRRTSRQLLAKEYALIKLVNCHRKGFHGNIVAK